jgi:hypothetical protein
MSISGTGVAVQFVCNVLNNFSRSYCLPTVLKSPILRRSGSMDTVCSAAVTSHCD